MTAFHDGSGVPGPLLDEPGELARLGEVEPRGDPVQRLQRERDLDQVGVSRPLAHPVDRALHPRRTRLHGGDRGCGAEAEVVVPVPVHGNVAAEPVHRLPHEVGGGLRRRDPDRVDDDDLARARLDRRLVRAAVELEVGARRVDAEERDLDPGAGGERDRLRIRSSIVSRETPSASSLPSEIGLSITEAGTPSSTSASTSACTAREKPHTSACSPAPTTSSTARQSSSETRGKPASIRSIPAASSAFAISSLSSGPRTTPTDCSPSRNVVS